MTPINRNTRNPRPKARHAATHSRTPQQVGNVRMSGGTQKVTSSPHQVNNVSASAPTRKAPRSRHMDQQVLAIPIERGEFVLTRRHFVYAAATAGAVVAIGGGTYVFNQVTGEKEETPDILSVSTSSVSTADSMDQVEATSCVAQIGDYKLPYGTLVWCNDDKVAACLVGGSTGKPLNQVMLLWLSSGNTTTLLEEAVGTDEGFEIIDVRATSSGLMWVEEDMLQGDWRIYTATLGTNGNMGSPLLVEQGDSDLETPSIALAGSYAFWQVLPKTSGARATDDSVCRKAQVGSKDVTTVWESQGRMATPPYATADRVVITPRADSDGSIHYQLVCLKASTGEEVDSLVLPASMKPLEAGYSDNGFTFAFDAIYSNSTGIANLGTYAPATKGASSNYSDASWFRWARTPSCAPANCGDYLIVKSTTAVCGVNLKSETYFAIDVESGSADYGDMLASSGSRDAFVTYANVTSKPLVGSSTQYCHVRVWTAL